MISLECHRHDLLRYACRTPFCLQTNRTDCILRVTNGNTNAMRRTQHRWKVSRHNYSTDGPDDATRAFPSSLGHTMPRYRRPATFIIDEHLLDDVNHYRKTRRSITFSQLWVKSRNPPLFVVLCDSYRIFRRFTGSRQDSRPRQCSRRVDPRRLLARDGWTVYNTRQLSVFIAVFALRTIDVAHYSMPLSELIIWNINYCSAARHPCIGAHSPMYNLYCLSMSVTDVLLLGFLAGRANRKFGALLRYVLVRESKIREVLQYRKPNADCISSTACMTPESN